MKRTFLFYIALFFFSASNAQRQPLMPMPQNISYTDGKFALTNAVIVVPKEISTGDQKALDQFILMVKQRTGLSLSKGNSENNSATQFIFKFDNKQSPVPVPGEIAGRNS